jgi:hypothetical protein
MKVFYNGRKNRTKTIEDDDVNSDALTVKKRDDCI